MVSRRAPFPSGSGERRALLLERGPRLARRPGAADASAAGDRDGGRRRMHVAGQVRQQAGELGEHVRRGQLMRGRLVPISMTRMRRSRWPARPAQQDLTSVRNALPDRFLTELGRTRCRRNAETGHHPARGALSHWASARSFTYRTPAANWQLNTLVGAGIELASRAARGRRSGSAYRAYTFVTRRYSSRLLNLATHSPEDSEDNGTRNPVLRTSSGPTEGAVPVQNGGSVRPTQVKGRSRSVKSLRRASGPDRRNRTR